MNLIDTKILLQDGIDKCHQLQPRERVLLLVVLLLTPLLLTEFFLLRPLSADKSAYTDTIHEVQAELLTLEQQRATLEANAAIDPDEQLKTRLNTLSQDIAALDEQLKAGALNLIKPRHMTTLLRNILTYNTPLQLLIMVNHPPTKLDLLNPPTNTAKTPPETQENTDIPSIFQHDFELTLKGDYAATLQFVAEIENLPSPIFLDEIRITLEQYPTSLITLKLHTLSLNQKWIGL